MIRLSIQRFAELTANPPSTIAQQRFVTCTNCYCRPESVISSTSMLGGRRIAYLRRPVIRRCCTTRRFRRLPTEAVSDSSLARDVSVPFYCTHRQVDGRRRLNHRFVGECSCPVSLGSFTLTESVCYAHGCAALLQRQRRSERVTDRSTIVVQEAQLPQR